MMEFPQFRYHPDPIGTESVVPSTAACVCCGRARGFLYDGPVYTAADLRGRLCPWCIADGTAARRYDAVFVDPAGVGDYGSWEPVPADIVDEVSRRTPGFSGWQQERWWTHCGDAAEFLGRAGEAEAVAAGPSFLAALQADAGLTGDPSWDEYLAVLDRDGSPTAYLFRCRHCGRLGGYSDCD